MTVKMVVGTPCSFVTEPAEIARCFDAATLAHGKALLSKLQIEKLTSTPDGQSVSASVQIRHDDSAGRYHVGITRYQDGKAQRLICKCSCSVGLYCAHCAAVLLSILPPPSASAEVTAPLIRGPIADWINLLAASTENSIVQHGELSEEDRVIYVLQEGAQGVNATIKRSKPGKKGDYLKGTKIAISDFRYHMPHWIADEDQQILNLLTRRDSQHDRFGELFGDVGYFALQKIIQTGRCFWDENRIPLTETASAKLRLSWRDEKQSKRLHFDLIGHESWEIIYSEPPMFVDFDYLKIGQIDTALSGQQLQLLKQMPSVGAQFLPALSEKLAQHFSLAQLPLPIDFPIQAVPEICLPKLFLTMANARPSEPKHPVVKLRYVYGDCELDEQAMKQPLTVIKTGSKFYQIKRDLALEQQARQFLAELGMQLQASPSTASRTLPSPNVVNDWSAGNLPDDLSSWLDFTDNGLVLWRQRGWLVETDAAFDLNVVVSKLDLLVEDDERGWFSLALTAEIDGVRLPLLPIIAQWLRQNGEPQQNARLLLPSPSGSQVLVDLEQIRPLIGVIEELFRDNTTDKLRLPPSRANLLNELHGLHLVSGLTAVKDNEEQDALSPQKAQQIERVSGQRVMALAEKLKHFEGINAVGLPNDLKATLRDYQAQGLSWLCFLREYQLGGILADDMGLGKTLQALAFVLKQKQSGQLSQGALIICPTSLVGNWLNEAIKFTPSLKVVISQGHKRRDVLESMSDADIVVTTYPLISRDKNYYEQLHFDVLILDEAQLIKNRQAKVTQVVNDLNADFKLCLTGTPLENHLGELKSLMDFCLPGLLGEQKSFVHNFQTPIEKHHDSQSAQTLQQRIAPFLLRRTKDQVASELPAKTEIDVFLELEKDQRNLYESIRIAMEKKLRELFARNGVAGNHLAFFDALLKLRQSCCDARLVKLESAAQVKTNAKLGWLQDNLPEMIEEGRKVLIFSQFTSMLSLIEAALVQQGISFSKLTGDTRDRQAQIDAFQLGERSVFLISLKAGGTGLNLTAADTVIHYDPWWNPAAERQATDRAYRIGQQKPVFVYKLITQGTVEEKIQQMQQYKQSLSDSIFSADNQQVWQGNADDLMALLN